jgi:hypothetical protein
MNYVPWVFIIIGSIWLIGIVGSNVWPAIKTWWNTSPATTPTTTITTTTATSDLTLASTACVTLTELAWKYKNPDLAAKVAEVWTLVSKVPA